MPHEWNNKIVVTKEELIPDFFPSWDALRRKVFIDAKKPVGIRRAQRGGGLNCEVLFDYDSLPAPIREQLGDPRKIDCILERFYWTDKDAVTFYANTRIGKSGYIPIERQNEYILDASVLSAAIRLRSAHIHELVSKKGKLKNIDKYVSSEVNLYNEFRKIKNQPRHTLPSNHIRLKDKLKRFEEIGYTSLLKGYDNQNALKKTENIEKLLNAMYIQKEKPSQLEVFRLYDAFLKGEVEVINPETGEQYNPAEYGKLSVGTVTSFLASWREQIATHLKRSADRQRYMAKFEPWQTLEHPQYAGSIISIDDRQPPFVYDDKNNRVWFYMGIDLGSECYVSFVWGKNKDSGFLLDFYRELVRNCTEWNIPVPSQLECESHLNSTLKETLLREGNMFEYVDIYPNSARSKRIERYFGALRYGDEKKMEGWQGRPFALDESNQTNPDNKKIIPYDLIVQRCLEEIADWNNSPHTRHPDKTRWEVYRDMQHPEVKPTNWRGILPYIGEKTETSCNQGQIRLNGDYCLLGDNGNIYTGDSLLDLMEMIEGKGVDIFWLRGHKGQTLKALVYMDGRCICEALPKPVAKKSRLEARNDQQAANNMELVERYKNTVRGWARRHKNEIEKLIIVDNRKRTLNDNFKIDWVATGFDLPVYRDDETESEAVEILNTEDEFNPHINIIQTGYKRRTLTETF